MKKKLSVFIFFLGSFFGVKSQNLVPNYSFEDTIQCPPDLPNRFAGYVASWKGGGAGLCYFNPFCNPSGYVGVPSNWWSYCQYAHTGHSYAGMFTYVSDTCTHCPIQNKNFRDYMQDSLAHSLQASLRYYVTFYVSPSDTSWYYCSSIGAYFSDSSLVYNDSLKSTLTPQVANNSVTNPLTTPRTWTKVSGSFVAKGGEQYIVIGNFKSDSASASSIVYKGQLSTGGHTEPDAFYYIDDVIVTTDSNYADSLFPTSVQNINSMQTQVKVYPNPSTGTFNYELRNANYESVELQVYNMLGQEVYNEALRPMTQSQGGQAQGDGQIDLSNEAKGLYFYRVISADGSLISSGKMVLE